MKSSAGRTSIVPQSQAKYRHVFFPGKIAHAVVQFEQGRHEPSPALRKREVLELGWNLGQEI